MDIQTSRREDTKAGCLSSRSQPARLDQYTILELARLPIMAKEVMVEGWLERVYGTAVAPAKAPCEGSAGIQRFGDFDKRLEECSIGGSWPSEGRVLASRPPTSMERSALCDVDTEMVERKIYKWRHWPTESI